MPTLVYRTGDYIRLKGLEKPWPDPAPLRELGVQFLMERRGDFYEFSLARIGHEGLSDQYVQFWQIALGSGKSTNMLLVPGGLTVFHPWNIAVLRNKWLHLIEVSQEIAVTFDEPINLSGLDLERINSKDIIDIKIPKNSIPPR